MSTRARFARHPSHHYGSMRPMLRRVLSAALAFVVAWHSCVAFAVAAEPDRLAEAREMANAAADDLEASRFEDALKHAKRAEELYHAPPHMLMMAEAYEGLGRLVEALESYERLTAEPLSPSAPAPFRKAQQMGVKKEQQLLSRVPSILIDVTGARIEESKARVDGRVIPLGNGVATRLDPGTHKIRVEAPGFEPREVTVDLADRGGVVKIPVHLEVSNARHTPDATFEPSTNDSGQRTLLAPALLSLGLGTAAVATGIVTGLLAFSNAGELEKNCVAGPGSDYRCPTKFEPLITETRQLSHVSTGTFIVGGVAVGTGILLLVLGKPKRSNTAFYVEPILGLGGAAVRGRF
jgi:hypothetical protein